MLQKEKYFCDFSSFLNFLSHEFLVVDFTLAIAESNAWSGAVATVDKLNVAVMVEPAAGACLGDGHHGEGCGRWRGEEGRVGVKGRRRGAKVKQKDVLSQP